MHRALSLTTILCGVFACLSTTLAQPREALIDVTLDTPPGRWLVGVAGGSSWNFHTGGFRAVPGRDDVPVLEEGSGAGYQIGVVAEYLLSSHFALDGRIVYDVRPGHFETTWPDTILLWSGETLRGDSTAGADVDYRLVTADLLLGGRLAWLSDDLALMLAAGPSFGMVVGTGIDHWVERTDGTGTRSYVAEDRPVVARNDTRLAIKAGGGFEWHAAERLWVNARALYELGFTDVTVAENWQLDGLLVQLDLLLAL